MPKTNIIPFQGRAFYTPIGNGEWCIDTEELGKIIAARTGFQFEAVMTVLEIETELLYEAGVAFDPDKRGDAGC